MITVSKKKNFAFQMPPTDNELWAVGAVAVHWSQLETLLHFFMQGLLGKDSESFGVYAKTRAMDQRLAQIEAAIDKEIIEPQRSALLNTLQKIKNAQYMRDRIMHDTWAGTPKSDQDAGKNSVFNWIKPRQPLDWNLDFGSIVKVAKLIDQALIELIATTKLLPSRGAKNQLMSDALQQIRRKPSQS
jgi:hypothetical protein